MVINIKDITKITITSNGGYWAVSPSNLGDIGQIIEITNDGKAVIKWSYWKDSEIATKEEEKHLDSDQTKEVFDTVFEVYQKGGDNTIIYDIGSWEIELTDSKGGKFYQSANLIAYPPLICRASDKIREILQLEGLFVFDDYPIYPEKLAFVYLRDGDDNQYRIMETIDIDAKEESIKVVKSHTNGCVSKFEYIIPDKVSEFLRYLDMDYFREIADVLDKDYVKTPANEHYQLEITVTNSL